MSPQTIRIIIEEMEQDGEKYYFWSSPDVSGFILETETLAEAIEIAPEVMKNLLEAKRDRLMKEQKKPLLQYTNFFLNYSVSSSLQLA